MSDLRPSEYADLIGQRILEHAHPTQRKSMGQYFTPVAVADLMASLALDLPADVRILDPGAGSGVLAASLCERLATASKAPDSIHVDAYEVDATVAGALRLSMQNLGEWLARCEIGFSYQVLEADFISANAGALHSNGTLWSENAQTYDVVIANPPYFKVQKSSHYARIAREIVHGQPNIYAIFMAAGAALLNDGGKMVVITPRSFASGAYFRRFRQVFFHTMQPKHIHLFGSREAAFGRDEVLQEWVVLALDRRPGWHASAAEADSPVTVTHSVGVDDIHRLSPRTVPVKNVLDMHSPQAYFRMPLTVEDDAVVATVDSWESSLASLGLMVSTGRVVPFRATQHLLRTAREHSVPLLWMNNVSPMKVTWPLGNHKPEHIADKPETRANLLVRDDDYVLIRRFSSKEQLRRLVAAPLLSGALGHGWLGLENHLNYVYFTGGERDRTLLLGVAVLLNSRLLDNYFRVLNGNTEVSATELRSIPLPSAEVIRSLGRAWRSDMTINELDELVGSVATKTGGRR